MWTKNFWKQAAERAAKSAAQSLIGLWALDGFNVLHAHWDLAAGVAGGAAVLSVLTSIVTAGIGEPGDPSAVAKTDVEGMLFNRGVLLSKASDDEHKGGTWHWPERV